MLACDGASRWRRSLNRAEETCGRVLDPDFRIHILEPLEVYGVDAFEPTQLVIKGRIKTVPLKQWTVGRELRKRIAKTLRERGIRMPGVPVIHVAAAPPAKPQ